MTASSNTTAGTTASSSRNNLQLEAALPTDAGRLTTHIASHTPGHLGLLAVAGSRAYGLDHADSDIDVRGVYVAPTEQLLGLSSPKESFDRSSIDAESGLELDVVCHELGKFTSLALAANPNILEVLFADHGVPGQFILADDVLQPLLDVRHLTLSRHAARTYGGYMVSQIKRMERAAAGESGTGEFRPGRAVKAVRHALRLADQGLALLRTGQMHLRVNNPEELRRQAQQLTLEDAAQFIEQKLAKIDEAAETSPLPPDPDRDTVSDAVRTIRLQLLDNAAS